MTTVRIARVLPGPPDQVWHALTRPDALAAWFWPEQFGTTATIDLRPGGQYRIAAASRAMADAQTGDDHALGWSDCLDRLPSWLIAVASGWRPPPG